ncbi:hypothetical protein PGB90_005669 [Kerria lacca]
MAVILHKLKRNLTVVLTLIWCLGITRTTGNARENTQSEDDLIDRVLDTINNSSDDYEIFDGITIRRNRSVTPYQFKSRNTSYEDSTLNKITDYARTHSVDVKLSRVLSTERSLSVPSARFGFGKNSFLTGFGLGFLAFGLKKLLLPIFIGAQIIKSILIAMFLPSILGSVGKLVGKGVTTFAQSSGSSNFAGAGSDTVNDFDFKDTAQANTNYDAETAGSDTAYNTVWTYPTASANNIISNNNNNLLQYPDMANYLQQPAGTMAVAPPFNPISSASLFGNSAFVNDYATTHVKPTSITRFSSKPKETQLNKYYSGSFYSKDKTEDFKVFHNIPSSSHLLANYDPFYSPLLSRIDSVFKQLGYTTEPCRERLVCNMYKNPAKYAPFSNLVSAQLSRELNELRKPSSDNPEILRFFKYMKAAKDGQDGQECDVIYSECTTTRANSESAPMVSTYNEINKLVQARNL